MRFVKVMDYNTRIRTLLNIDAISAIQEAILLTGNLSGKGD